MAIKAFRHLPDEREGHNEKLQCETVVLPGDGDCQKVKNEQTIYADFLHVTKL